MKKVAIYTRSASSDLAISCQLSRLKSVVEQTPDWCLYQEFIDYGASGNQARRPGLEKAIKAAEASEYDILLVVSPDRFYRDAEKTGAVIKQFQNEGVELMFYKDGKVCTLDEMGLSFLLHDRFDYHPSLLKCEYQSTQTGLVEVSLPMPEDQLRSLLERTGIKATEDYDIKPLVCDFPIELMDCIERNHGSIFELNRLCEAIQSMDEGSVPNSV